MLQLIFLVILVQILITLLDQWMKWLYRKSPYPGKEEPTVDNIQKEAELLFSQVQGNDPCNYLKDGESKHSSVNVCMRTGSILLPCTWLRETCCCQTSDLQKQVLENEGVLIHTAVFFIIFMKHQKWCMLKLNLPYCLHLVKCFVLIFCHENIFITTF